MVRGFDPACLRGAVLYGLVKVSNCGLVKDSVASMDMYGIGVESSWGFLLAGWSPANRGAASAELMPGTSSAFTPAAASALSSLLLLEKTDGQPPFRRTTCFPCPTATLMTHDLAMIPSLDASLLLCPDQGLCKKHYISPPSHDSMMANSLGPHEQCPSG